MSGEADEEIEKVVEALEAAEPAAVEAGPPLDAAKAGAKRLPKATWIEIEAHWVFGTLNAVEISKKYGVTTTALTEHFRRRDIRRNSKRPALIKAAEEKVAGVAAAAINPIAAEFENKRASRIAETRETHYRQSSVNTALMQKVLKEIVDGARTPADCHNDLKSLYRASQVIKANKEVRLSILRAEQDADEGELPSLVFRDLSKEEIEKMANADKVDELDFDLPEIPSDLVDEDDDVVVEEGGAP